jgi:predicted ATPase
LHKLRKRGVKGEPLHHVADELLEEGKLLCFDEFQVIDDNLVTGFVHFVPM